MAEKAEKAEQPQEGKKKKGKLPIIIIAVLVLAGGGFFGLKMKNGGVTKPEVKLSKEKPLDLKEFLVNLKDQSVYCQTEISLGFAEGVDSKAVEDQTPVIRDAVNSVLKSETVQALSTPEGMTDLKHKLADAINQELNEVMPPKNAGSTDKSPTGGDKNSKGPAPAQPADPKADASVAPEHPDWDSQTGPVLKIYIDSFATE